MRTPQSSPATDKAESTRLRLTFLALLVVSLFVLLFARLWFLQVMAGERYASMAQGNAIRSISIEAPRGKILDRSGRPIVRNRYANVISVKPSEMGDREDQVMADVAELLGVSTEELYERVDASRVSPFRPKPVAIDVHGDVRDYIHENAPTRFVGVYAETLPLRDYPNDSLGAHVLGYLGEISGAELDLPQYDGYRPGDIIGRSGVERVYEQVLRGVKGQRRYVVNAHGRVTGSLEEVLPKPGSDLRLTVDLEAQRLVEEALTEGVEVARRTRDAGTGPGRGGTFRAPAGAAVVLDPRNGEVVAMASYPTFDPTEFVGGVTHAYWDWLNDEANDQPLINRAVEASYPPGSVFKPVSAAAALEGGYATTTTKLPCPRRWEFGGNVFRNWRTVDMPSMNLAEALVDSCDTVFYEYARRMWQDEMAAEERGEELPYEHLSAQAKAWGFGRQHGIDLPGERAGVVPGREWKLDFWTKNRDRYCAQVPKYEPDTYPHKLFSELCSETGSHWRGGDAVNMSIGQGDVQTTPLQVASAFAAIANRGTLWRPRIASAVLDTDGDVVEEFEPEKIGELPVRREFLDYIDSGLQGVTGENGTAGSVFAGFPVKVAGKTGTAELKPKQPFAWFAAYGPVDSPRYVVVAMIEEGGSGSQVAAPIARKIFEGLFGLEQHRIEPGVPTD